MNPNIYIEFGDFTPDQPRETPGNIASMRQMFPVVGGYVPVSASVQRFNITLTTTLSGGVINSAFLVRNSTNVEFFYYGSTKRLYRNDSQTSFTNVSQGGRYVSASGGSISIGGFWSFDQWGDTVVAANENIAIQTISLSASATAFSDLVTSVETPKAKYLKVHRDFLVIGNVTDSAGAKPSRVRWSGINDPADFDVDVTTQSDFQDLQGDGGEIQGFADHGDFLLVFQRAAIWRMTYVGPPLIFQFDLLHPTVGLDGFANSIITVGRVTYAYTNAGFIATDGSSVEFIGQGKVDVLIGSNLVQLANLQPELNINVAYDRSTNCVRWNWTDTPNNNNTPKDKHLAYSVTTKRWADPGIVFGATSDDVLTTGRNGILCYDKVNHFFAEQGGLYITGITASVRSNTYIETGDIEIVPGSFVSLQGINIVMGDLPGDSLDVSGATITITARDYQNAPTSKSATFTWSDRRGHWVGRITGRYFRIKVTPAFGSKVKRIVGVRIVDVAAVSQR